jgi:hypothetical protein
MTAQQQPASRDVRAPDESMSPEAVAAMERRLLEAFAAHHRSAGRSWGRWVAAAAALGLIAGGFTIWHALPGRSPGSRAVTVQAPGAGVAAVTADESPSSIRTGMPERGTAAAVRPSPASVPRRPARRREPEEPSPAIFVPLPGAAGLPRFESGSIVRVDLPLSSLAAYGVDISAAGGTGPVPTDVLVGQDGEARAIRLAGSSSTLSTSRSRQ